MKNLFILLFIFSAYAFVSDQDYQDAELVRQHDLLAQR